MSLRVKYSLQQLLKFILGHRALNLENLIPNTATPEKVNYHVIQINFQDANVELAQLTYQLPLDSRHFDGFFGFEGANKEGNFTPRTLSF
jgi:hypothetical protein